MLDVDKADLRPRPAEVLDDGGADPAATAGDEDDAVLEAGIDRSGSGSHSGSHGGQRLLLMELRERRGGWRGQCNSARSSAVPSPGSLPRIIMPSPSPAEPGLGTKWYHRFN